MRRHKNKERINSAKRKADAANSEVMSDLATRATEMAHAATAKAKEAKAAASPHIRSAAASAAEILGDAAEKTAELLSDTAEKLAHSGEDVSKAVAKAAHAKKKKRFSKIRKVLKAGVLLGGIGGSLVALIKSPFGKKLKDNLNGTRITVDTGKATGEKPDSITLSTPEVKVKAKVDTDHHGPSHKPHVPHTPPKPKANVE